MNANVKCPVCSSDQIDVVDTLRHQWIKCRQCGCASSFPKKSTPLSFLPFWKIKAFMAKIRRSTNQAKMNRLVTKTEVSTDATFDDISSSTHNEWQDRNKVFERFVDKMLKPMNIDLKGKTVIDISGGNGYITSKIKALGTKEMILTEFNSTSVEMAKKEFGLEAYVYDSNVTKFTDLLGTSRKFDVILVRSVMPFVTDIRHFFNDMLSVSKPGTLIIIEDCIMPTFRSMFEWQLENFIAQRLWSDSYMKSFFAGLNVKLIYEAPRTDEEAQWINDYRTFTYSFADRFHKKFWHNYYTGKADKKITGTEPLERANNYILEVL